MQWLLKARFILDAEATASLQNPFAPDLRGAGRPERLRIAAVPGAAAETS